jgi:hypothetical protein
VQWVRQLVRALAAEGRTVFLSSHLMSEMSQTAGHLLVIGRGRIIAAGPVQQVIDSVAGSAVRVRSPRAGELAAALAADGATVTSPEAGMQICWQRTPASGAIRPCHRRCRATQWPDLLRLNSPMARTRRDWLTLPATGHLAIVTFIWTRLACARYDRLIPFSLLMSYAIRI